MKRADLLPFVSFALDDSLNIRTGEPIPEHARLVAYQCGFELMVGAVWSYLPGCKLDACDAEDIARDYLLERAWFGDEGPRDADYII